MLHKFRFMRKLFVLFIAILFIPCVYSGEEKYEGSSDVNISFIFDTNGTGYSLPAGINFIIKRHMVLWYYEDGHTRSFVPSFEINGSQFGIGIIFFGIWKAPGIFQQPGYITGMGLGIVFIFVA